MGDIFAGWQVFENPPVLEKDGYIKVPQGPGLGVTLQAGFDRDDVIR